MIYTHSKREKELEDLCTMEEFPQHKKLANRMKKTLYYGYSMPKTDRPSLPLTEIAVELFQDASPKDLGQVDTFLASNMAKKACMSPCSMMLGMIYIERLKNKNPEYLQKMSSADLFLLSMMMASKYLYDEGTEDEVFNDEWAESASMDLEDLNRQEKNYLSAIDWRLFVEPRDFYQKVNQVETRIALEKSRERGWMTYTDICVLSRHPRYRNLVLALSTLLSKVIVVCSVAYAAAVGTMLASTIATMALKERLPIQLIMSPVPPLAVVEQGSELSIGPVHSKTEDQGNMSENETVYDFVEELESMNKVEVATEENSKKSQPIGFPGLITLALLQDTVCQFIDGVKLKFEQGYDDMDQNSSMKTGKHCVRCKDCSKIDNSIFTQAPANSSGLLESMYASQLRCTCGKGNNVREKQWKPTESYVQKDEKKATKLWNLVSRSPSTGGKHRNDEQGQGGDHDWGFPCCCGNRQTDIHHGELNLPVSELVLTHGQTLTTISLLV